jgi:hypothetical protein
MFTVLATEEKDANLRAWLQGGWRASQKEVNDKSALVPGSKSGASEVQIKPLDPKSPDKIR